MTNKRTYNRIATVLMAIMLMIIAFAIPMRTASADETTSKTKYRNMFEGATVNFYVRNTDTMRVPAYYANLIPVYDVADTQYQGIDFAATLAGINISDEFDTAVIEINFSPRISMSGEGKLKYTDTAQSGSADAPRYSPEIEVLYSGGSIKCNYSDKDMFTFWIGSSEVEIRQITLQFSTDKIDFASILAPVIEYEASDDDNTQGGGTTQPGGDNTGDEKDDGDNQGGTTQPGDDNGTHDEDELPSPQVPSLNNSGSSTFYIVLLSCWLAFAIILALLLILPKKRK